MLRTLAEKVNPEHAGLLVVDIQNDFCHESGFMSKLGRDMSRKQAMVPRLVRLIDEARRHGVPVTFVRSTNNSHVLSEVALEEKQRLYPGSTEFTCPEGAWGAEFYAVSPMPGEAVVTKHRYSGFVGTDLDVILRCTGIRTLIITGVATNICVASTARDGFMRDYYIVFTADCTAASNIQDHEATLRDIQAGYGVLASSDEVMAAWKGISAHRQVRAETER